MRAQFVREHINEFEHGGDPYEKLGIGSKVPSRLKSLGFNNWDDNEKTYLDRSPGSHTFYWGNWGWDQGWKDQYTSDFYLSKGELDFPDQNLYWEEISITDLEALNNEIHGGLKTLGTYKKDSPLLQDIINNLPDELKPQKNYR